MLTADDIRLHIASGEGYNVEFKRSVPSKVRELSEEVCALANAAGGVVLIGVDDAGKVVGVSVSNALRSAIQTSLGHITPSLRCSFSVMELDGNSVGVIEVPSGPNKPYVLSGAIYVRIGPNTQKLTTAEQMRDFFQQSGRIYFDEAPCEGFSPEKDVDEAFLAHFRADSQISASVPHSQLLRSLRLFTGEGEFKNGGVLFFGYRPEHFFTNAMVRCVAFGGKDKRFIADDKTFGGPLHNQYRQTLEWLRSKLNVRYEIEGSGTGPRTELWEIPVTVFREAVINALAHRDYSDKGAVTTVEVFDDHVEITNPGGLAGAIPRSDFGRRSHARNPLIFGLFARMRMVEQVGSGIIRIRELMREAGLPEPIFSLDGMFTVSLMRASVPPVSVETEKTSVETSVETEGSSVESARIPGKESDDTRSAILNLLRNDPGITVSQVAAELGRSNRAIEMQFRRLREEKVIIRVGPNKGGRWEVLK